MKVVILFLLAFLSVQLYGQEKRNTIVYSNLGGGIGNYFGLGAGLTYPINDQYSIGLAYYGQRRKPVDRPEDYGFGLVELLSMGKNIARDRLKSVAFTGGVYLSHPNGRDRWHLRGGLSYSAHSYPINWQKMPVSYLPITESYTYDMTSQKNIGLIINPVFEWNIRQAIAGLSVGPYLLANRESVSTGLEVNLLIGLVR